MVQKIKEHLEINLFAENPKRRVQAFQCRTSDPKYGPINKKLESRVALCFKLVNYMPTRELKGKPSLKGGTRRGS